MDEPIKPCPFCGGEADYHSEKGPTGEVYGWVGCNQCDAMSCHTDTRSMQPEETHPIDAWNTRADAAPTPKADEVEAVADVIYPAIDGPHEAAVALSQSTIAALDAARSKAGPVAWMYRAGPYLRKYGPDLPPVVSLAFDRWSIGVQKNWTETPLYAHPPVPDAARGDPVARVVEWLRELSGDEPLPPGCTKGEVWILRRAADAIERGEPFNG